MDVDVFWSSYEVEVGSFEALQSKILHLSDAASRGSLVLAWRGQADSSWGLHSKLYRDFVGTNQGRATEAKFAGLEARVLTELRKWGLHSQRDVGRLSILSQLAMLQHFGAPTRFLDISFNALIGAFFAVEDGDHNNKDARLFAIDITHGLINERKHLRRWEDSIDTPWSDSFIANDAKRASVSEADIKTFKKNGAVSGLAIFMRGDPLR